MSIINTKINLDSDPEFTPLNFRGLKLWLDANDVSTLTIDSSDPPILSLWNDKSGNDNNPGQSTVTFQPQFIESSPLFKGQPVIRFDGLNDFLVATGLVLDPTASNLSIFIVFNPAFVLLDALFGQYNTTVSVRNHYVNFTVTPNVMSFDQQPPSGGDIRTTNNYKSDQGNILSYTLDSPDQTLRLNGIATSDSSAETFTGTTPTIWQLGARDSGGSQTSLMQGDIAEVIIYDRSLDTVEVETVERYLSVKWCLPSLFTPDDLVGLQLWLDADDSSSLIVDMSNLVSQWNDKSGNANNATQMTVGSQPKFISSVTSNRQTVNFDGVDDFLAAAGTVLSKADQSLTMFVVFNSSSDDAESALFGQFENFDSSNHYATVTERRPLSSKIKFSNNPPLLVSGIESSNNATLNNENIFSVIIDTSSRKIRLNGIETADALDDTYTGSDPAVWQIGSRLFFGIQISLFTGDISEIIIYDKTLSSDEIDSVEAYLSDKWGVSI